MGMPYRPPVPAAALAAAAILAGAIAVAPATASAAEVSAPSAAEASALGYAALPGSVSTAPGKITGTYTARRMTVEVSLTGRDTAATAESVEHYLHAQGLAAHQGSSPTLVRATGSSAQVSKAFRTTLSSYTGRDGSRYFANSTPVYVPASLAPRIIGIIGLSNTLRLRPLTPR